MRPRYLRMPFGALIALSLAPLATTPAGAQTRDDEVTTFTLVSDLTPPSSMYVNPAAVGLGSKRNSAFGLITWERASEGSWSAKQFSVGLQTRVLAFGYRHDEFENATFANGDAYTLALGGSTAGATFGASHTWRTVGSSEGSWVLGAGYITELASIGFVWRDLGSPTVRDTARDERVIAAITLRPGTGKFTLMSEADFLRRRDKFRRFRFGGGVTVAERARVQALVAWAGDGEFEGFTLSARLLLRPNLTGAAAARLDSDGDARAGTLGLDLVQQVRR